MTLYRKVVPTPLVPWCVEQQQCAAGVMITASHNPKEDNGGNARFFLNNRRLEYRKTDRTSVFYVALSVPMVVSTFARHRLQSLLALWSPNNVPT
eukprot:COSAG02_NODE_2706_length_8192_cov_25.671197_3_plen_95_part_00